MLDPEYKAPDDKSRKNEESARAVEEYMNNYKKEPWYIGQKEDDMNVAMKRLVEKKVPLPTFARQDM